MKKPIRKAVGGNLSLNDQSRDAQRLAQRAFRNADRMADKKMSAPIGSMPRKPIEPTYNAQPVTSGPVGSGEGLPFGGGTGLGSTPPGTEQSLAMQSQMQSSGLGNNPYGALPPSPGFKKGGAVSASRRGDGIAQRGKTKGRII